MWFFPEIVRLNTIMLIFYQFFPRCCCWCLVLVIKVVSVSFASVASFCHCCCRLLVVGVLLLASALESCCHCCIFHGGDGVPPHGCFIRLCCIVVIIVVSVLLLSLGMGCSSWRRCPFSWILFPDLLPLRCRCCRRLDVAVCVSLSSAVSLCHFCFRLLVIIVNVFSSLSVSRRCHCFVVFVRGIHSWGSFCRLLRLVVVVVVESLIVGFLLLLSAAVSWCPMKSLVYIRLNLHATTMGPQHQAQNGTAVISGVWRLNLVWTLPQSKLTYPFVPKFQQVIGTNIKVFESVLALLFSQQVLGLSNRCTFLLPKALAWSFINST